MTTKRAMGEPFFGTGKPPEGYKPGDYVEYLSQADGHWHQIYDPNWATDYSYRLPADHPHYLPPIRCLDKAAQLGGYNSWEHAKSRIAAATALKSIIAHARTLRDGCEPMQEPVDPLEAAFWPMIVVRSCRRRD